MTKVQPLKIGIIGLGTMGKNHLRILSMLKSVELVFLYDLDNKVAEQLSDDYEVYTNPDLKQLLTKVDAVVICTPTVTHSDYIRMVGESVKNIFVEKPLVDSLEEANVITKFCTNKKINLQVGFIERFNPAVQRLKEVLDQSEKVISIDFTRTNKLSSRIMDVDVVTDLMIHDIDLALYLNGPAKSVSAHGFSKGKMIDFASALIIHQNGRFSRLEASRITDKKIRLIQATCLDMYVDCELIKKEIVINRNSKFENKSGRPFTISAVQETVEVLPQEALLYEIQAFVSSCQGEIVPEFPGIYDGLSSMHICNEIQKNILK